MRSAHQPILVSLAFLGLWSCSAPPTQNESIADEITLTYLSGEVAGPYQRLRIVYPEEAIKKHIAGNVILSVAVDAKGYVTEVKVLSGPPELTQSAVDTAKSWRFLPPKYPPAITKFCFSFGVRPCPGGESDSGYVSASSTIRDSKGLLLIVANEDEWTMPAYPEADRKAGASGDLVLGLTINSKGDVSSVRVINSLSPHLDKLAIATAYTWKYKVLKGDPAGLPDEFPLPIRYTATCSPDFDLPSGPLTLH
jgi:TonB family protein